MPEFKKFPKIERYDVVEFTITQKLHGSNAQVYIFETENGLDLLCGSRSRWITPEDDNFGFAKFVQNNKQDFMDTLGIGRHYGEWVGKGINTGEGLIDKQFFLFNWKRWVFIPLPENVRRIPLISHGHTFLYELDGRIECAMEDLKESGSKICPGYMKPEGIVIEINGVFYKKTFENEEVAWKCKEKSDNPFIGQVDVSHLLQPLRLEKLLSRDEKYVRDYPRSLPIICADYVNDLEEEGQFFENDEEQIKAIKRALGRKLFSFVKATVTSSAQPADLSKKD
jgi:hypothetical protein